MLLFECLYNQFYVILFVILIILFGVKLDGGGVIGTALDTHKRTSEHLHEL